MQHTGDSAVVDGFVRAHGLRVILLDKVVDLREGAEAVTNLGIAGGGIAANALTKQGAQATTQNYDEDDEDERAARTTDHQIRIPQARLACDGHSPGKLGAV